MPSASDPPTVGFVPRAKPAPRWVGRTLVLVIVTIIAYMVTSAIYLRLNHRELEQYAKGPGRPGMMRQTPPPSPPPAP